MYDSTKVIVDNEVRVYDYTKVIVDSGPNFTVLDCIFETIFQGSFLFSENLSKGFLIN